MLRRVRGFASKRFVTRGSEAGTFDTFALGAVERTFVVRGFSLAGVERLFRGTTLALPLAAASRATLPLATTGSAALPAAASTLPRFCHCQRC